MCVVVRFFDIESEKILMRFWDLLQIYDPNDQKKIDKAATAENLFKICIESFDKYKVNTQFINGLGSDGWSVKMGPHNSVSSRMKT